MEKTYRTRRDIVVLAWGSLFLFGCLGVASLSLPFEEAHVGAQTWLLTAFGGLTSAFFVGMSYLMVKESAAHFTIEEQGLKVETRQSGQLFDWKELTGYRIVRPELGAYRLLFGARGVEVPFDYLTEGEELKQRILQHLSAAHIDEPVIPERIVSRFEAWPIMVGCFALIDILFVGGAILALKEGNPRDLLIPALAIPMNFAMVAFVTRKITLEDGVLNYHWMLGDTTICLPEVRQVRLRITHGKASRFEETEVIAPNVKIRFSSADANYVALRNQILHLARNAELQDNRPQHLHTPLKIA